MAVKRKNKNDIINALTDAQKLIFAPIAFCALNSATELGIIEVLDNETLKEEEIIKKLNLDEYTVRTLLDVLLINELVSIDNEKYSLSKKGRLFLYDDMTR